MIHSSNLRLVSAWLYTVLFFLPYLLTHASDSANFKFSKNQVSVNCPESLPILGWSTWNAFRLNVNETLIREAADWLSTSDLSSAGYNYILLDDGWTSCAQLADDGTCLEPAKRDSNNRIVCDPEKFPNGMAALASYVHSRGLKIGIYTAVSGRTCGGFTGSLGYEAVDAATFADWGYDLVKHDTCNTDCGIHDGCMQQSTSAMSAALRASGRNIFYYIDSGNPTSGPRVFNPSNYFVSNSEALTKVAVRVPELIWTGWGKQSGANMVKSWFDRRDDFRSVLDNAHHQASAAMPLFQRALQPDDGTNMCCTLHFPDMLTIGMGGLTSSEERVEIAIWSILGAPLILGADIRNLTPSQIELLTNPYLLSITRDPACIAGTRVHALDATEVWVRSLSDGTFAAVLLNKDPVNAQNASLYIHSHENGGDFWPASFGGTTGFALQLYDVLTNTDIGVFNDTYVVSIPPHDVQLLRLSAVAVPPQAADDRPNGPATNEQSVYEDKVQTARQ